MIIRLRKFLALPLHIKALMGEAFMELLISSLILRIFPFRKVIHLYSNPAHAPIPVNVQLLLEIKSALLYAGHLLPWKARCLVRALAARRMFLRRGIPSTLSLGLYLPGHENMAAHAWLTAGNQEIIEKNGEWQELFSF